MLIADPVETTCPRCAATSKHKVADWLALAVACPACGESLAEAASKTKAMVDDWGELVTWAEVSLEVEERLGIDPPGIDDGSLFPANQRARVTLHDLARLIADQFPERVDGVGHAARHIHAAVEAVAGYQVSEPDFDRPIIDVVVLPSDLRRKANRTVERPS